MPYYSSIGTPPLLPTLILSGALLLLCACGSPDDGSSQQDKPPDDDGMRDYSLNGVVIGGAEGGDVELLSDYTVCLDINRTWTCQDDQPDPQYRTTSGENGQFTLEFTYDGNISDYLIVAEPGNTASATGYRSGIVSVAASNKQYALSGRAYNEDDLIVISPFTTLVQEEIQYTGRAHDHVERRIATALGLSPADDDKQIITIDYRDAPPAIVGNPSHIDQKNLAEGLNTLFQELQAKIEEYRNTSDAEDADWLNNPGAVRNFIASRAMYYIGGVAEEEINGIVDEDDIDLESGIYDIDLEGSVRQITQQIDEDNGISFKDRYRENSYLLSITPSNNLGDDNTTGQALQWRKSRFDFADEKYNVPGEGVLIGQGSDLAKDITAGTANNFNYSNTATGTECVLDSQPIRIKLGYAVDLNWPISHLVGQNHWKKHKVHQAHRDYLDDYITFTNSPPRYIYRGGLSCNAAGKIDNSYVNEYFNWQADSDFSAANAVWDEGIGLVRFSQAQLEDWELGSLPDNWGDFLAENPTLVMNKGNQKYERWDFLISQDTGDQFRGLVEIKGDGALQPGYFRYETFKANISGGERLLYIDTTPSGATYGRLLRLHKGNSQACAEAEDGWCILARNYLLRGSSNENLWFLNEAAAQDIEDYFSNKY